MMRYIEFIYIDSLHDAERMAAIASKVFDEIYQSNIKEKSWLITRAINQCKVLANICIGGNNHIPPDIIAEARGKFRLLKNEFNFSEDDYYLPRLKCISSNPRLYSKELIQNHISKIAKNLYDISEVIFYFNKIKHNKINKSLPSSDSYDEFMLGIRMCQVIFHHAYCKYYWIKSIQPSTYSYLLEMSVDDQYWFKCQILQLNTSFKQMLKTEYLNPEKSFEKYLITLENDNNHNYNLNFFDNILRLSQITIPLNEEYKSHQQAQAVEQIIEEKVTKEIMYIRDLNTAFGDTHEEIQKFFADSSPNQPIEITLSTLHNIFITIELLEKEYPLAFKLVEYQEILTTKKCEILEILPTCYNLILCNQDLTSRTEHIERYYALKLIFSPKTHAEYEEMDPIENELLHITSYKN